MPFELAMSILLHQTILTFEADAIQAGTISRAIIKIKYVCIMCQNTMLKNMQPIYEKRTAPLIFFVWLKGYNNSKLHWKDIFHMFCIWHKLNILQPYCSEVGWSNYRCWKDNSQWYDDNVLENIWYCCIVCGDTATPVQIFICLSIKHFHQT